MLAKAVILLRRSRWQSASAATVRDKANDLVHDATMAIIEDRYERKSDEPVMTLMSRVMWSLLGNEKKHPGSRTVAIDTVETRDDAAGDEAWDGLGKRKAADTISLEKLAEHMGSVPS